MKKPDRTRERGRREREREREREEKRGGLNLHRDEIADRGKLRGTFFLIP